jgi:two-component system NtrC family sensor kinase
MRRAVEYGLAKPVSGEMKAGDWQPGMGSLHRDPKAAIDPKLLQRDLSAASRFLIGAAATHQWNPIFQWTYYYDQGERWVLVYPEIPFKDIARAAKTDDPSAVMRFFFDADGTRPVATVGPRNNPKREMLWTAPYHDAAGKGMMVTLLAPVYLGDEYVGAMGTDITLKALTATLRAHGLGCSRRV